jgi:hypothetical protein
MTDGPSTNPVSFFASKAMNWIFDLLFSFLLLGLIEGLIKPVARNLFRKKLFAIAPQVLERLDSVLPTVLGRSSGEEIESYTRRVLHEMTGEDWSDVDIEPLFSMFDIRKAADSLVPKKV